MLADALQATVCQTQKRFSDFEALRNAVVAQRKAGSTALAVPALPEKKVVGASAAHARRSSRAAGNFQSAFLERRRLALQAFLQELLSQDPNDKLLAQFFDVFE